MATRYTLTDDSNDVRLSGYLTPTVPSLLGPYPVAFNTPDIDSQAGLVQLAVGTIVVRSWLRVTTAFDAALTIGAGGAGALSNGDWQTTTYYAAPTLQADAGAWCEPNPTNQFVVGLLSAGWLVANVVATQGAGFVYAQVLLP